MHHFILSIFKLGIHLSLCTYSLLHPPPPPNTCTHIDQSVSTQHYSDPVNKTTDAREEEQPSFAQVTTSTPTKHKPTKQTPYHQDPTSHYPYHKNSSVTPHHHPVTPTQRVRVVKSPYPECLSSYESRPASVTLNTTRLFSRGTQTPKPKPSVHSFSSKHTIDTTPTHQCIHVAQSPITATPTSHTHPRRSHHSATSSTHHPSPTYRTSKATRLNPVTPSRRERVVYISPHNSPSDEEVYVSESVSTGRRRKVKGRKKVIVRPVHYVVRGNSLDKDVEVRQCVFLFSIRTISGDIIAHHDNIIPQ